MKKRLAFKPISLSALEDEWQRLATAEAIAAARKVVRDGPIPGNAVVERLTDQDWGWIVAAILFAWIRTRAQQATAEELDVEQTIRMVALHPRPWDAGAVAAILGELADACPDLDWNQPLTAWPKETMVQFLLTAMRLIERAMVARDLSDKGVTRKSSADVIARQANASAGGSSMTADEFSDEIGL
jgi:hypothetical protein